MINIDLGAGYAAGSTMSLPTDSQNWVVDQFKAWCESLNPNNCNEKIQRAVMVVSPDGNRGPVGELERQLIAIAGACSRVFEPRDGAVIPRSVYDGFIELIPLNVDPVEFVTPLVIQMGVNGHFLEDGTF